MLRLSDKVQTRISPVAWLAGPLFLLFLVCFVMPFCAMLVLSATAGNPFLDAQWTFTTAHYAKITADSLYVEALGETLWIGLVTTVTALGLGYPLAHLLARARTKTAYAVLLSAVVAPMLTGLVVRTFAWMTLLSDAGVVNSLLLQLGLISKPLPLMYNEFGVVVALVHIYLPFMVLTLAGVIGQIDERVEEAARLHGASPVRCFFEVTLPLSLPGVLAGSLLVFALAISAYVTPYLMGGRRVLTLPMLIYQQVAESFDMGFAAALGAVMLAVSLGLIFAYNTTLAKLVDRGKPA
jgi:putative spermidine/putrescine transport system permease protein